MRHQEHPQAALNVSLMRSGRFYKSDLFDRLNQLCVFLLDSPNSATGSLHVYSQPHDFSAQIHFPTSANPHRRKWNFRSRVPTYGLVLRRLISFKMCMFTLSTVSCLKVCFWPIDAGRAFVGVGYSLDFWSRAELASYE